MTDHLNSGQAFFFIRIGAALAGIFGALALLVGVALMACYVPARRAASIGPIEAIRIE